MKVESFAEVSATHKPDRARWTRPEIRKLRARAAELGGATTADGGTTQVS